MKAVKNSATFSGEIMEAAVDYLIHIFAETMSLHSSFLFSKREPARPR